MSHVHDTQALYEFPLQQDVGVHHAEPAGEGTPRQPEHNHPCPQQPGAAGEDVAPNHTPQAVLEHGQADGQGAGHAQLVRSSRQESTA